MMGLDRYRAHYKSNIRDHYDRAYCTQSLRMRRYKVDFDYMKVLSDDLRNNR